MSGWVREWVLEKLAWREWMPGSLASPSRGTVSLVQLAWVPGATGVQTVGQEWGVPHLYTPQTHPG